jgi:hypothetical protein
MSDQIIDADLAHCQDSYAVWGDHHRGWPGPAQARWTRPSQPGRGYTHSPSKKKFQSVEYGGLVPNLLNMGIFKSVEHGGLVGIC